MFRFGSVAVLAAALAACGDGHRMMTGPNGGAGQGYGFALTAVTPAGGATGVATSTTITLHFGGAMAMAMEQYVDLHLGDLAGPTVPMGCAWSADRTMLTCIPAAPLAPRTTYVLHLGGGMATQSGDPLDFWPNGPGMGGRWVAGAMMGAGHAGHPWGTMGPAWRDREGRYGMAFPFTTA